MFFIIKVNISSLCVRKSNKKNVQNKKNVYNDQ